jgi:hypothetical protein
VWGEYFQGTAANESTATKMSRRKRVNSKLYKPLHPDKCNEFLFEMF